MRTLTTDALLLRSVPYGESDLIATFLTETEGKLSAIVRGARKSTRRFAGALEPVHTLHVRLDDKGKELCFLREARLAHVRERLSHDLEALEAAGAALRWARGLCPPRTPEPAAWSTLLELLDSLDEGSPDESRPEPKVALARAALRLLADVGWALDLSRCVACGRARPEGKSAYVDASRGGIVCRSCWSGAAQSVSGEAGRSARRRLLANDLLLIANAAQRGDKVDMSVANANELIALVEDTMAAHTD